MKAKRLVTIADVRRTLDAIWPELAPLLEHPHPRRPGRHDRYSNQQIFGSLLHAYFEGVSLRNRIPARGGPAPGSLFYKLNLWTTGDEQALDQAWATYLRAIPLPQLRAWRARLLGFAGPVAPPKDVPRYTSAGPPPRLLRILIEVWDERARRAP